MADKDSLTITNIVSALKNAGFATKDDLKSFATKDDLKNFATKDDLKSFATKDDLNTLKKEITKDIGDTIHNELTNYHADMVSPEIDRLRAEIRIGLRQTNSRLARTENDIRWIRDEVKGLKEELSITPSKKDFEEFKKSLVN